MFIDTHVHLDDTRYNDDRDAVISRAKAAGVGVMVSIGTGHLDSAWACEFAAKTEGVYATVGHHPEYVETWTAGDEKRFAELAKLPKVVAVGEIGFDLHRPEFSIASQEPIFRALIGVAREAGLPLVIHQRDAAADTLRVLKDEGAGERGGLFHCFAGDWDTAKAAMDLGFDIAVGGILTFSSAKVLRGVIEKVPLERIALETDGPWLAPQTWRGQRNEPAYVKAVAAKLAEIKNVSLQEVERVTSETACRALCLPAGVIA